MRLTGIITQGASHMGTAEFIKSFKVASSFDGKMYMMYKSAGPRKDKVDSIDFAVLYLFFSLFLGFSLVFTSLLHSCRCLLETLIMTAPRRICLIPQLWLSTFASSLWCAAKHALCAWSWLAANSMVISNHVSLSRIKKQFK